MFFAALLNFWVDKSNPQCGQCYCVRFSTPHIERYAELMKFDVIEIY